MTKNKIIIFFGTLLISTFILNSCNRTTTDSPSITEPTPTEIARRNNNKNYICPKSEWVNCMPGPGVSDRPECEKDFLNWAQENCPNFKGAAY